MNASPASVGDVTRVVHVITDLQVGGAEIMLLRLLGAFDDGIESSVICLGHGGPIADRIRALGVRVVTLGLPSDPRAFAGLLRLRRLLRELEPNLVHTWLYHADLLGGLAAKSTGTPVVWALHATTLDVAATSRSTTWLVRILAHLSRVVPAQIVSCSEVGRTVHEQLGYDAHRLRVIPNGFDTELFRPNAVFREEARAFWGCDATRLVVGHVARFNAQKDHQNMIKAAGIALRGEPRLHFVFYGADVTPENPSLVQWAREAQVFEHCSFLGLEPEIARRLPGLDLLVSSSSSSEAFPLILGEGMATGVPCVTTDVGDSGLVVGDAERVVPTRDPRALAAAILRAVQLGADARAHDVQRGTARIRELFDLRQIAGMYRDLYREVVIGGASP